MGAADLSAALARLGLNPRQLGELADPPVGQSHMYEMAKGSRPIGKAMAVRLRLAMARATPAGE
jgi:hypothetical protein